MVVFHSPEGFVADAGAVSSGAGPGYPGIPGPDAGTVSPGAGPGGGGGGGGDGYPGSGYPGIPGGTNIF